MRGAEEEIEWEGEMKTSIKDVSSTSSYGNEYGSIRDIKKLRVLTGMQ